MQPDKPRYPDSYIETILVQSKRFAFIGASAKENRPSYFAMKYLISKGYEVVPVNPGIAGQEILGQRVFATLSEVPEPVDIVDIFRNSKAALKITEEAISLKDKLALKVIWMQLGVINHDAAAAAAAAGLDVVMDRCPKIEYGRLSGEIGWSGINSGTLSSKRPRLAERGFQDRRLKS